MSMRGSTKQIDIEGMVKLMMTREKLKAITHDTLIKMQVTELEIARRGWASLVFANFYCTYDQFIFIAELAKIAKKIIDASSATYSKQQNKSVHFLQLIGPSLHRTLSCSAFSSPSIFEIMIIIMTYLKSYSHTIWVILYYILMNRQGRVKRQNEGQTKQRYQACYAKFVEGQFSYSSHVLLKRIWQNGQSQPYMGGIPLGKIMLEVVKIMMMNELQILFLGSTLQEMKWKVTDHCLNQYLDEVTDVTPGLEKDLQAQRVQLSLLLIAYIVKIYLNEENSLVDFKIRDIIKGNFDRMYQNWVQKVQNHFKFNPKNMNRLFRELDNSKRERKFQIVDYNRLVSDFFKQNDINVDKQSNSQEIIRYEEHQEPPIQEQRDQYNHESIYRKESQVQINRRSSDIFMTRRSSANEFLMPEDNRRSKFEMVRNQSIDDRR